MSATAPEPKPDDELAMWELLGIIIDETLPAGPFVIRQQVPIIQAKLAGQYPQLYAAYCAELVQRDLAAHIGDRQRTNRRLDRYRMDKLDSSEKIKAAIDGGVFHPFEHTYCISKTNVWKPLGQCKRDDLAYIADSYERDETFARVHKALFRKLAAKVTGDRTLADVMTEAQYTNLYRTIVKP